MFQLSLFYCCCVSLIAANLFKGLRDTNVVSYRWRRWSAEIESAAYNRVICSDDLINRHHPPVTNGRARAEISSHNLSPPFFLNKAFSHPQVTLQICSSSFRYIAQARTDVTQPRKFQIIKLPRSSISAGRLLFVFSFWMPKGVGIESRRVERD